MQVGRVTYSAVAPSMPSAVRKGVGQGALTTWDERISSAVQIDISWAAELREAIFRAPTEKAANVQNMLATLDKIDERTDSLRSYIGELRAANNGGNPALISPLDHTMSAEPAADSRETEASLRAGHTNLRETRERLQNEVDRMQQDTRLAADELDAALGVSSDLSPEAATEMAAAAAGELLRGFDILLGIDDSRQTARFARLLRDESGSVFRGT